MAASVARVPIDTARVREELSAFIALAEPVLHDLPEDAPVGATAYLGPRTSQENVVYAFHGVERLLDVVLPSWRGYLQDPDSSWQVRRSIAVRAVAEIDRGPLVQQMLGQETAPRLLADRFHPWAWGAAQSMWSVGAYDRAVEDALARVNAETRNKVGRRDLGETKLFQLVFSTDPPKPGVPRLRLMADDGSDTYKSLHRGATALAEGLFALLRNPTAHEVRTHEGEEQVALERLAAVSVLARTVDQAQVARA